jgi:hypothetical protein
MPSNANGICKQTTDEFTTVPTNGFTNGRIRNGRIQKRGKSTRIDLQGTKFTTEGFRSQMNSQTDDGFKERMKIATEIFTAQ